MSIKVDGTEYEVETCEISTSYDKDRPRLRKSAIKITFHRNELITMDQRKLKRVEVNGKLFRRMILETFVYMKESSGSIYYQLLFRSA